MSKGEINAIQEALLVMRAQARDEKAFQQLVAQYERRLLYYIHRILGNDADRADVLQEIWIRVFLKITTLRTPEAFRVWLYKIAHDASVSQLRKSKRRETRTLTDEHEGDVADTNDWNEFELLEDAQLVHDALGRLSLPHREVLTLRFLEELELADIAEVVGCGVGTVKSRLHYAKSAMRQLLQQFSSSRSHADRGLGRKPRKK
jgi:RNA polymerase sigma-70 factor (ECF subfamily)